MSSHFACRFHAHFILYIVRDLFVYQMLHNSGGHQIHAVLSQRSVRWQSVMLGHWVNVNCSVITLIWIIILVIGCWVSIQSGGAVVVGFCQTSAMH